MKVLVACEFSGVVREAFSARGHIARSCDIEATEIPGLHYRGDVRRILNGKYDLLIAFPPCTYLCRSGARWHRDTEKMYDALSFVAHLMSAPIPHIAVENPIGAISTHIRRPDQIIQPWQFGHNTSKATCLWLKNLPQLTPTEVMPEPHGNECHYEPPGPNRSRNRSRTYAGIAAAMADQWSTALA